MTKLLYRHVVNDISEIDLNYFAQNLSIALISHLNKK